MTIGIKTVVYPIRDLAAAKALYSALLGVPPHTDEPYYVGFTAGDQEIGLDPNGHAQGITGPVAYTQVADINQTLDALQAAGAQPQRPVTNVGGGRLIATVTDPDGNPIGLLQDP
jgi:predicted enzyme related to lactoylglutathione lyase